MALSMLRRGDGMRAYLLAETLVNSGTSATTTTSSAACLQSRLMQSPKIVVTPQVRSAEPLWHDECVHEYPGEKKDDRCIYSIYKC